MMKKLVFTKKLSETHVEALRTIAPDWEIIHGKDSEVWLPHLKDAEIVGGWNRYVNDECVQNPESKLRWLHNWGAGVDQLPLDAFKHRGILLTNSSGVHAYPISETILAMMLALTRQLHAYVRNQMEKKWHHANLSLEMHGKTVGILGVGAIGSETARLCKAFGMRVLGVRRSGQPLGYVDRMYDHRGLHEVLVQSDYVINTLPFTNETHHFIGEKEFRLMKRSAFYINIGRGNTTDESALIEALKEGRIAGAGLDVFEQEPLSEDSPLWEMENVIITPHTSGSTEHYDDRVMDIFLPNFRAYLEGKEPTMNLVDLDLQY
jgi:phosphoglycerate dehydrogenase-like enzyme